MRMPSVMLCALLGCAIAPRPTTRFVLTDASFAPAPRQELPTLLIDQGDLDAAPAFKVVGVLEVQGIATDTVDSFLARVSQAGAHAGCEVVEQRDLFERMIKRVEPAPAQPDVAILHEQLLPTREWIGTDEAVWQFLCGVRPASPEEARESFHEATLVATRLRNEQVGAYLCEPYIPTGSHIPRTYCARAASPR